MNRSKFLVFMASIMIMFTACDNKSSNAEVIKTNKNVKKDEIVIKKEDKEKKVVIYEKNDDILNEVFKDSAKIAPDGKQMILIFGTNTDPYSDKLKADIKKSSKLQERFKNEFSSYYLKAHENLRHKQFHEGEFMDVDTKTMIMVYGIEATPTLIFTDKNAKAVIVVPGYIPTKQFLVTMDFMKEGKWKGKNRKNGEVYEALRDFYIKNGIKVKTKKDK